VNRLQPQFVQVDSGGSYGSGRSSVILTVTKLSWVGVDGKVIKRATVLALEVMRLLIWICFD
jgi:hypothetical protein